RLTGPGGLQLQFDWPHQHSGGGGGGSTCRAHTALLSPGGSVAPPSGTISSVWFVTSFTRSGGSTITRVATSTAIGAPSPAPYRTRRTDGGPATRHSRCITTGGRRPSTRPAATSGTSVRTWLIGYSHQVANPAHASHRAPAHSDPRCATT